MPDTVCPKCGGSGYIAVQTDDISARTFRSHCDCVTGQAERKKGWEKELDEAGIPREFWDLHFDNFEPQPMYPKQQMFRKDVEYYLKNIKAKREEGMLWLIFGQPGTGKTLGGCLILKQAIKQGYQVKYTLWTDLIDQSFIDDNLVTKLREVDFLVIDDLGKDKSGKDSRFIEDLLEKIIKHRFSNKLPTILLSPMAIQDLQRRFTILPSLIGPRNCSLVEGVNKRHIAKEEPKR